MIPGLRQGTYQELRGVIPGLKAGEIIGVRRSYTWPEGRGINRSEEE